MASAGFLSDRPFLPLSMSQVYLGRLEDSNVSAPFLTVGLKHAFQDIRTDTLIIPLYVAGASAIALLAQLTLQSRAARRIYLKIAASGTAAEEHIPDTTPPEVAPATSRWADYVRKQGGLTILAFNYTRLVSCLALFILSSISIFHNLWEHRRPGLDTTNVWLYAALSTTFAYATLLALVGMLALPKTSVTAVRHLVLVLFSAWAVYFYRDVWPFATYNRSPLDTAEGALLWAKIAILTIAGVLVPLFVPRRYIPFDPKNPYPEPHPEQTASVISYLLFVWLERTVYAAYRVPHLPLDRLPPLADYDDAQNLVKKSFSEVDPFQAKKGRHIMWGLFKIFRRELAFMGIMISLHVVTRFVSPLGMKYLLSFMEYNGAGATVRPWVWLLSLLIGPIISVSFVSMYFFISSRVQVRMEALLTQLVFEHALRMRVKAEVPESPAPTANTTAVATPDNASVTEESEVPHRAEGSNDDATLMGSSVVDETDSTRGKQKAKKSGPETENGKKAAGKEAEDDAKGKNKNLVGKINNLITSDLESLAMGRDILMLLVMVPVQLVLCVWFLYDILGWSALVGLAVIIVLLPLPGYVAKQLRGNQIAKMKKTDARVQNVTEALNVIRMIKLFGWEFRIADQLREKRDEELRTVRTSKLLQLCNNLLNHVIPLLNMLSTYVIYTVVMKQQLSASTIYSAMTVFDMFSQQMHQVFQMIPSFIRAKVSLDRVNDFLLTTELLDQFTENPDSIASQLVAMSADASSDVIGFRNVAFTWANEENETSTPGSSKRNFVLRIEEELYFRRGRINLVVGPTGSGKTSILMALLGEMHYIPSGPDSFFNLPRAGGVAYAAQESWVQNETIRDNILFGAPYDEERYNKVIDQCALRRDLDLFDAGDMTEVGEKGITLSGGQKARVTLARAIYSTAEILLLDDVLAALDVHTARWIIEKCLQGELVTGRTVLLVTHNVVMASPIATFVVAMGTDGRVSSQGTLSNALLHDRALAKEVAEEREKIVKVESSTGGEEPNVQDKKSAGKLIVAEEIAEGHLGWSALKLYLVNLGGKHLVLFWICLLILLVFSEGGETGEIWFLGYWAEQYEKRPADQVKVSYYLSLYAMIMVVEAGSWAMFSLTYIFGSLRASKAIHNVLIQSLLGTTLRWLDKTPTARIIARCTQDIDAVDGMVQMSFGFLINLAMAMLVKLVAIVITSPIFLIPGVITTLIGSYIGHIYMKAQLSVKRERSNARAPVLGHVSAAFAGLVSIRAYGAQDAFRSVSYARINRYTRASNIFYNLSRWVSIRIEVFGALFSTSLATYFLYVGHGHASTTGFTLTMAIGFSNMILWLVRMFNEFEVAGNSLERIQQYLDIEQEPKPTESGIPPAYWPASGDLRVEKLSARYSPDGPLVLQDISFQVKSGERVGIVGRTGSGKSSLTLALLRCIITEGSVYYDGIATEGINLDALRSNVTIIPQVPELLSGTLRQNLDPFEEHDDAVLNDALRSAGLFSLQKDMTEGQITLDTQIASAGSNLSVGQKQILALARAVVRQSKLLILDEATSAIDYETDTIIQASLRKELDKGVTLLTVAHRLQTIMDSDKIMVLDAGRIVEFGKPHDLLKNETGLLRALVDESGDKETLYAMAAGPSSSA